MVHLQMADSTDIARATTLCLGPQWLEGTDIESVDFELSDIACVHARGMRVALMALKRQLSLSRCRTLTI